VTKTLLFFGDSNTRGYGVGRERRFASRVARAIDEATPGDWTAAVAYAESDFRAFRPRLEAALERHAPGLLVLQCPTGPACWFVAVPGWLRVARRPLERLFEWRSQRLVARELRRDPARYPTPHDARYDGLYLDRLYRFEPRKWPGLRELNAPLARRYGLEVKATLDRYLDRMLDLRARVRARTDADIVFLGLLPADERIYPGYPARVAEWTPRLAAALDDPAARSSFVDPVGALGWNTDAVLLRDGTHLSGEGHRLVSGALAPVLLAKTRR
jgi:lysophospholipase L1-like esterase